MLRRPWLKLVPCVLAAGLLSANGGVPRPTVSSFIIHRATANGPVDQTYSSSATALVSNAMNSLRLTVKGSLLDLSTGADVVNASGSVVSGTSASISGRQGGNNTQIDIHVTGLQGKAPGNYRIRIHYAVETNGPDLVRIRLLARGEVTSITRDASPALLAGSYLTPGSTHTIRVAGTGLDVATINPIFLGQNFSVVSRSSSSMVLTVRFTQPGRYMLYSHNFYDENLGHVPTASDENELVVKYSGNGGKEFYVVGEPVVSSVPAQPALGIGSLQLFGSNFSGSGLFLKQIRYSPRYSGAPVTLHNTGSTSPSTFSAQPGHISVTAAYDMGRDPLELEFEPAGSLNAPTGAPGLTISVPFVANNAPHVEAVVASAEQATLSGVRVFRAGTVTFVGKYLFGLGATAPAPAPRGASTGFSMAITPSSTPPTVKLGGLTYPVNAMVFVAPSGATAGRDSVRVTFSDPPNNMIGPISLQTGMGTTSAGGQFMLATRPRVTSVVELSETAPQERVLTTPTLLRGRQYQIVGSSLSLKHVTQVLQTGTVRVGGRTMTVQPSADPAAELHFLVPLDATSGALIVATAGGETTVGNFTVTDAPAGAVATPRPTALSIAVLSVASGVNASATVSLDNPGASIAGFTVALSSSDPSAATVPATLAVPGTSAGFTITSKTVTAPRSVTITAASGGATQTRTLTVTPPAPATLVFSSADVVAGAAVTGTVTFTGTATGTNVQLSSSDAAVTVPASVTATGNTAGFAIATTEAPAPRTVTVTASANGVAKSATLTVTPLRILTVRPSVDTIRVGRSATITATVNRAPGVNVGLTVAVTDGKLVQFDQPNIRLAGSQTAGTIELRVLAAPATPTRVTITVSRSVATAGFGTVTTSGTTSVVVAP